MPARINNNEQAAGLKQKSKDASFPMQPQQRETEDKAGGWFDWLKLSPKILGKVDSTVGNSMDSASAQSTNHKTNGRTSKPVLRGTRRTRQARNQWLLLEKNYNSQLDQGETGTLGDELEALGMQLEHLAALQGRQYQACE